MIKFLKNKIKIMLKLSKRFVLAYRYNPFFTKKVIAWLFTSSETTNFTYEITERNVFHICSTISTIFNVPYQTILNISKEPYEDSFFMECLGEKIKENINNHDLDLKIRFGRRIAWYIIVRILKPKTIVETGIAHGLGSALMCYGLYKNEQEHNIPGKHYGLDINPNTGFLIPNELKKYGQLIFQDSLKTLSDFTDQIDIFINDSDHSSLHEKKEYEIIKNLLSTKAVIIGDNAHVTDELLNFSIDNSRKFIFISESPKDHWYPGSGVGLSCK